MTTKLQRTEAKQIIKDALKSVKANRLLNVTIRKDYDKIQRNEKCPCESGHKYKHCCQLRMHKKVQSVYEDIYSKRRLVAAIKKDKEAYDNRSRIILPGHVEISATKKIIV